MIIWRNYLIGCAWSVFECPAVPWRGVLHTVTAFVSSLPFTPFWTLILAHAANALYIFIYQMDSNCKFFQVVSRFGGWVWVRLGHSNFLFYAKWKRGKKSFISRVDACRYCEYVTCPHSTANDKINRSYMRANAYKPMMINTARVCMCD